MGKQTTVNILTNDMNINIVSESTLVDDILQVVGKHIHGIYQERAHDLRGRISSINMSLYMLERSITPESKPRMDLLKVQVNDLTRMIEELLNDK